jgi:superfamily II DNA or RNA helicase
MKTATTQQRADAAFLTTKKWACLFSEPGTGKTLTAITARQALPIGMKTLVIAPKIALTQWQKELSEQGYFSRVLRSGKDFRKLPKDGFIVTTWGLMTRQRAKLEEWGAEVIIADESHACIDWKSARTAAFYGDFRKDLVALATGAEWCWLLTGTPIVRYADDLWPMLNSMFPEKLTSLVGNRRRATFCDEFIQYRLQPIAGGRKVRVPAAGKNEARLNDALYGNDPIAVRRTLAEVDKDLPQERYRDVEIDLTDFDDSLIAHLNDEDLGKETEEVKSIRRAFGRAKVAEAAEYLAALREPVLVLTWHQDVTDALSRTLPKSMVVDGRTSPADRQYAIDDFAEGTQFLIGQIGAVGTALDGLQHACKRVVFVERIGSPALMDQAIARVVRRGQRESVLVETIRAGGHRLEAITDATLASKRENHEGVVG